MLRDRANPSHTALGRFDATRKEVVALKTPREGVMGVRPRNNEQSFALDLLLDESIRLVTLVGKAGTGKTLLALAAGLEAHGRGRHVHAPARLASGHARSGATSGFFPATSTRS